MIQVTVKNSKTGSQYICKSARRTVKNITYHMIQFTINSFSHGLTGRPYNSIKGAIQDGGSYSVWCNEKIKLAFSFGNGTEKDFKRYCKDNKCKIVSESEFYKELYSLPLNEQETHIQFIREQLSHYNYL